MKLAFLCSEHLFSEFLSSSYGRAKVSILYFFIFTSFSAHSYAAQLCFYRYEDNGSGNIIPLRIIINGKECGVLVGGQELCLEKNSKTLTIEVLADEKYYGQLIHNGYRNYKFRKLQTNLTKSIKNFEICSARSEQGAPGPWLIRMKGDQSKEKTCEFETWSAK